MNAKYEKIEGNTSVTVGELLKFIADNHIPQNTPIINMLQPLGNCEYDNIPLWDYVHTLEYCESDEVPTLDLTATET